MPEQIHKQDDSEGNWRWRGPREEKSKPIGGAKPGGDRSGSFRRFRVHESDRFTAQDRYQSKGLYGKSYGAGQRTVNDKIVSKQSVSFSDSRTADCEEKFVGLCKTMCPSQEIFQRQHAKDVSLYEICKEDKVDSFGRLRKGPFSDETTLIKKYHRSAAGSHIMNPEKVRTFITLRETSLYICNRVIMPHLRSLQDDPTPDRTRVDRFETLYEFASDRFRSVRQDFTVQRASFDDCFHSLYAELAFHLFAYGYCAKGDNSNSFSFKLCWDQIVACCSHALSLSYKSGNVGSFSSLIVDRKWEIPAVQFLISISTPFVAQWLQSFLGTWNMNDAPPVFLAGFRLVLFYHHHDFRNFFRLGKFSSKLWPLFRLVFRLTVPSMQYTALMFFNSTYISREPFSFEKLSRFVHGPIISADDAYLTSILKNLCERLQLQNEVDVDGIVFRKHNTFLPEEAVDIWPEYTRGFRTFNIDDCEMLASCFNVF